jgi:hypothetical protein
MPGNNDEPLQLTIEQAAKKLGRSVPATEHMIRVGKLKAVRIDSPVQVDRGIILALIDQSKESDTERGSSSPCGHRFKTCSTPK